MTENKQTRIGNKKAVQEIYDNKFKKRLLLM